MRRILITGATASHFLMACILMRSFLGRISHKAYILDFGLSDPQRQYLKNHGLLIERPPHIAAGQHPYFYKSAMVEFVGDDWETLVWVDSDMIAVGPVGQAIDALVNNMRVAGKTAAAFSDCTIGKIFNSASVKGWNVAPFQHECAIRGIDPSAPYYNVGCVVLTSRDFAREWHALVKVIPRHVCFEQNAFNLLVHTHGNLMELERAWNLFGPALFRATVGPGDTVSYDGRPALLIHLTSQTRAQVEFLEHLELGGGIRVASSMRVSQNSAIRNLQRRCIRDFLAANRDELISLGIIERAIPVSRPT